MAWLKDLPYEVAREATSSFCHGSPVNLEEFEYIFAPEQARECLPIWDELGDLTLIGHSHLCKSFALTRARRWHRAAGARSSSCGPAGSTSSASARSASRATTTTARSYTVYDTETKRLRVQARRVRHQDAGEQDPRASDLERNFGTRLFLGI